jgi:putative ABC transport system permease protein
MFGRLLWKLVRGNRGRLIVALIAVVSGAAVISALLNVEFDVTSKLTQDFRSLGANLIITPRAAEGQNASRGAAGLGDRLTSSVLMDESDVLSEIPQSPLPNVAAAPYLYVVARTGDTPVVLAGTWLDQLRQLAPAWKLEGNWIASRSDETKCLIGRDVARQFRLAPGATIALQYLGRTAQLRVAGIVDSGGTEDTQIFANLAVAQRLAGLPGRIQLVELSAGGSAASIGAYASQLAASLPAYDVRPIPQVTEAEGNLLGRTQLLILSMVILILVLTALCVLATMAALAVERRADVGLMKALGGSISRIVALFLAEVGALGAAGGLIGSIAGMVLAQWIGRRVFGTSVAPRWEIFPLTIALMVGVALAGALPLRMLGRIKPAVILRGE